MELSKKAHHKGVIFIVSLIMISVLMLTFGGCSSELSSEPDDTTVKFTSTDGKYEITADSSWVYMPGEINDDATLEVGNDPEAQYLFVIPENKIDFNTDIVGYKDIVLEMLVSNPTITNLNMSDTQVVNLSNGMEAYKTRIDLTVDDFNFTYWYYVLESEEDYVQVIGATFKSTADEYESIINEAALSFNEIK